MPEYSEQEQISALRKAGIGEQTINLLTEKKVLASHILQHMSEDDLKEIGITDLIERKKVLHFIEETYTKKDVQISAPAKVVVAKIGKSRWVAFFLWLFFGSLGAHRFYCQKIGTAIAELIIFLTGLLLWGLGIGVFLIIVLGGWLIVDLFLILCGKMTSAQESEIKVKVSSYDEH